MLNAGDRAPNFSLPADDGTLVRLADLRGKKAVLYFYPRDSTPGCTREAQAFSALRNAFDEAGVAVLAISKDSIKSHCSFRDKYGLRITLLSDPELTVHKAFGAYGEKTMYGKKVQGTIRSTFVVDDQGCILHVFPSVKVDGHADAVLALLRSFAAKDTETKATKARTPRAAPKK